MGNSKKGVKSPRRQVWHWGQHKVVSDKKRAHKRGKRKHKGRWADD